MDAEITYLFHSAFAVKTPAHFLIFDYYRDVPHGGRLAQGVVNPQEIAGENVVVFASHCHPDHYSPRIFGWRTEIPGIRYVLSDDIRTREEALTVAPGRTYDLGDLSVRTLEATDRGGAFLGKTDGLTVYHAGDLNWWKWEGDSEDEAADMERRFKEQVDLLRGEAIDVAFLPFDPRQGEDAFLGFDWFLQTVGPRYAVPMHSFGHTDFFAALESGPRTHGYGSAILRYGSRGEKFSVPLSGNAGKKEKSE